LGVEDELNNTSHYNYNNSSYYYATF